MDSGPGVGQTSMGIRAKELSESKDFMNPANIMTLALIHLQS